MLLSFGVRCLYARRHLDSSNFKITEQARVSGNGANGSFGATLNI